MYLAGQTRDVASAPHETNLRSNEPAAQKNLEAATEGGVPDDGAVAMMLDKVFDVTSVIDDEALKNPEAATESGFGEDDAVAQKGFHTALGESCVGKGGIDDEAATNLEAATPMEDVADANVATQALVCRYVVLHCSSRANVHISLHFSLRRLDVRVAALLHWIFYLSAPSPPTHPPAQGHEIPCSPI